MSGELREKLEAKAVKYCCELWTDEGVATGYMEEEIAQTQMDFLRGARIGIELLIEAAEKRSSTRDDGDYWEETGISLDDLRASAEEILGEGK
jgi:hypothetical protein